MVFERIFTDDVESASPFESNTLWREGAAAGFVATAVMGVAITVMNLATLRVAIAGLYGLEGSLVVGWIAHLAHGTLFGTLFAVIMSDPGLYRVTDWAWKTLAAGLVYGLVLAVVGAGIIMPIWLGAVNLDFPASLPFVTVPTLIWHAIYGFVLGFLFWGLVNR